MTHSGGVSQVTFRVRCESIGHGESVFLAPADNAGAKIPLFTTTKSYPWYTTRTPLSLALPATSGMAANLNAHYRYRYAVYRGGVFHRWEDVSDGGDIDVFCHHHEELR